MQKKKFDLTSEIINLEESKEEVLLVPQPVAQVEKTVINKIEQVIEKRKVLITIAVDEELRKEYKMWCTRKGLKMAEAFIKGYELLKKEEYN